MKKILFSIGMMLSLSVAYTQDGLGLGTNDPKSKLDVKGGTSVGGSYAGSNTAPTGGIIVEGQMGIGTPTPDASAILDLGANQKGMLVPRMTTAQRMGISGATKGLLVYDTDINNFFFHDGNVWLNVSTTGPLGPQGPKGSTGATGAQGAIGGQGPQGAQGPQGVPGSTGAIGSVGPQGAIGAQGVAGPQGAVGPQGNTGPTGDTGAQGPAGIAGPQGATGPQGAVGAAGPQGVAGPQGAQGPQGPQGVAGPQGAQGPAGVQGAAGAQGTAGPQGTQGAVGPQGAVGAQGAVGPQGPQGVAGPQGSVMPGSAAGATAYWNGSTWTSGTNLYNNGGGIGIGTTSPQEKLQLEGDKLYLSKTSFPNTGSWTVGDLVLGSNTDTRDGYNGTNGPHIMLRSSGKSSIAALDENNDLGQISYQNLSWTIGENIGWGNQNIRIPALSGGGNKIVKADNNGQLYGSNDVEAADGSYIQNQFGGAQSSNYYISGIGRADNGVRTGSSGTYNTFYTWTDLPGFHGFYSSVNNGAHISPNDLTFGSWRMRGSRNNWQGLEFDAAGGNLSLMMGNTGQGWGGQTTGIHNNNVGQWLWRFEHQRLWADGLTDVNNSGYYIDPNGGSNIVNETARDLHTTYLDFRHVGGNSGQGNNMYAIFQEAGDWTWPYPDLRIAYHTGIKFGANPGYNGIRFFSDYDMSSLVMAVNDASTSGGGNVYMSGQLGVGGTPHPSAALDVNSSNKGFYLPRMTQGQRDAIGSPPNGLMLYNTTTNCSQFWGGGSGWVNMACSYQPGSAVLYYTGGMQTFTVPSGVTSLTITCYGAKGGNSSTLGSPGGNGGIMKAVYTVSAGQTLYAYVGGLGGNSSAGWNGGGAGGDAGYTGGGGGASDVRSGGTGLGNRIIVAGGGGGAGTNCWDATNGGGAGGGSTGGTGYQCGLQSDYVGYGGSQGGGGGNGNDFGQGCMTPGGYGYGGNGACTYGGGGGGGFYGGGGGAYGGGGGGSNYASGSILQNTQGGHSAGGIIIFQW